MLQPAEGAGQLTGEAAPGMLGFAPGALGFACNDDAECDSGYCVSGRCCDSACDGVCEACSAAGVCNTAPVDDARCPAITCAVAATSCAIYPEEQSSNRCAGPGECKEQCDPFVVATDTLCEEVAPGLPGQCDANGDCIDPRSAPGAACATSATCALGTSCVDGVCCKEACGGPCESCDSNGECVADPVETSCGDGLQCFGRGACLSPNGSSCTSDAVCGSGNCEPAVGGGSVCCAVACSDGNLCNGDGTCISADSDLGTACTSDADCAGAHCFDGVCCDSECGGACERCNAAGQLGRCSAEPVGTQDPLCGPGLECAGRGQCLRALGSACTLNGECLSGECSAALQGNGEICCERACPEGQRCGPTGSCVAAPRPNGAACSLATDCSSNSCVAGRCCESACNGVCQACSGLGTCTASPGDDPRCPAIDCPTSNTVCVTYPSDIAVNLCSGFGSCRDRAQECRPTFAPQGLACEVINGVQGRCDGAGNCADPRVGAGSVCTTGSQCTSGLCVSGICRDPCRLVASGATQGSRYDQCVLAQ